MRRKFSRIFAVLVLIAVLAGCSGGALEPYTSQSIKRGEGLKMAILPFDNLSDDQGAGKMMENLALVEFLKRSPTKIVDPGEVSSALIKERVRLATSIPKETLKRLGASLGVDLFLVGIVHECGIQRASGAGGSGEIPVVSLTLRILDAETGDIVWAISSARRGNDRETAFGMGRIDSLEQLAQSTAMELAKAYAESMRQRQ
jgi:TolB-like protein